MTMTDGEIVRSYQEAAYPVKQIRVLADLNACTPAEIREVLKQAGYRFGRGGNPVQEPASPAYLPKEARVADSAGLPTQEPSQMDVLEHLLRMLEQEINRATDQLRAVEEERARLEEESTRLRKICDALYTANKALTEACGKTETRSVL